MIFFSALLAIVLSATSLQPKAEVRNVRISSPRIFLSREKSDSSIQVVGQFKIEMSFAENRVRKPVVRLCCLCEVDGTLYMKSIFLDRPGTLSKMSEGEIRKSLLSAGFEVKNTKKWETLRHDPSAFTPYLHEVGKEAYASAMYGSAELKRGFFRLKKSTVMPKLLVFRIELWQNGVLVAKYESSQTGLRAQGIPPDWHMWKKYPQKIKY